MSEVVEIGSSDSDLDLSYFDDLDASVGEPLPPTFTKSKLPISNHPFRLSGDNQLQGGRSSSRPAFTLQMGSAREGAGWDSEAERPEAWQPKAEANLPEGLLSVPLFKHQKIALAWMERKENSSHCAGGILADEQGLGKTVSIIALILKQKDQQDKFTCSGSASSKLEAFNLEDEDVRVANLDNKDKNLKVDKVDQAMTDGAQKVDENDQNSKKGAQNVDEVDMNSLEQTQNEDQTVGTSSSELVACDSYGSTQTRPAGGTLVVCPPSVLKQWAYELSDKLTESSRLSVLMYHGSGRTRNPRDLANYDVVLTTYTIVTNEVPKQSLAADDDGETKTTQRHKKPSNLAQRSKRKLSWLNKSNKKRKRKDADMDLGSGPLARVRWFRVVLDEAQNIKNYRTQVAVACCGLRAKRRWCLSGTPIQNAVEDLYSYFRFLKLHPLNDYATFVASIKLPISKDPIMGYKRLQAILRKVLLRRTKDTLIDGEPIIKLPPKSVCLTTVEFTRKERAFYMKLEEQTRQQFRAYAAAGTVRQNYANILVMLLRLRQACDHPLLASGVDSEYVGNDSIQMARQLSRESVKNLLNKLERCSAICTLCSDPPEDAVVALCGHVFCYQCISVRLNGFEDICPVSSCSEVLSTDTIFSRGALKICLSDDVDRDATTSGASSGESSISQPSYISAKIQAAINIINSVCSSEEDTIKAIVFSQWTSMLDLVELSLNNYLIQYRRLDGKMTLNARDTALHEFDSNPEIRVMLMSLKAGSLGLNMVAACHVILLDLWWNPYAEDQAVDRTHRIGQTRPVTVSKLAIQDTVEDRILAMQEEKRRVVDSAFGENRGSTHTTRLSMDDLRFLFRV